MCSKFDKLECRTGLLSHAKGDESNGFGTNEIDDYPDIVCGLANRGIAQSAMNVRIVTAMVMDIYYWTNGVCFIGYFV